MKYKKVYVKWLDSCMLHTQVDEEDLPTPRTLKTVGWLSKDTDDYLVVSRDYSPHEDSYSWRSSIAIPKQFIQNIKYLK